MVARLVGDTLLDECPGCHGVWLDAAGVDRLVRERRQVSTEAVLGMGGPLKKDFLPINPPGRMYVKCPECETIMNRTNFAKRSGILIDTCRGHGTWFDADELPRVVDFVMNGGIEAATEANLRQMKSDARLAESKARAARSQSSVMMTPVGRHGFGGRDNLTVSAFGGLLGIIGSVLD
jgi:Zn-finger nucleic acid-binding protein